MNSILERISSELCLDKSYLFAIVNKSNFYYKRYSIPKRNGSNRVIYQASPELKSLQYWVRENILKLLPISNSAFAYQPGSSIKKHAEFHKNAYFVFHTDVQDFFPSIHAKMLIDIILQHKNVLKQHGVWYDDTCDVVSKICFKWGQLVIGTVSSPIISNIVMYAFDEELSIYSTNQGYHYSRYADDIYISSNSFIPYSLKNTIACKLKKYGLAINQQKTWFRSKKSRRKVTGLVITDTGYVSIGSAYRNKIKKLIYNQIVHGIGSPDVTLGYLAYLKDIEPLVYNQYMIKYSTYCDGDVIDAIRNKNK